MATLGPTDASDFEPHRRHLTGLAYRMLGSVTEADDVVQDAYLRWHSADRGAVDDARAFLSRVVTRLCLDHLKSARVRRERYVGPWLPEPVVGADVLAAETASEYAHDLSVALMLALERLSPLERAAFLLHDVFDLGFAQIARALGRSETACRQLAARARAHVKRSRPRFPVSREAGARIAEAFLTAARSGDAEALTRLLAEDAVLQADGGGKKLAALRPVLGREKITRFFVGLARKADWTEFRDVRPSLINGQPGFVIEESDGSFLTLSLDVRDDLVTSVHIIRNPDKLRHIAREAGQETSEL
jgi:RNA polymerase sigma-70 factor (ECF subfamily)